MGIVSEGWVWLGANSKQVGALSSIVFGVASGVLAGTALLVAYRSNFGWKPTVLLLRYGYRGGSGYNEVHCEFEVWNRRKYAVVVREIQVVFGTAKLDLGDREGFSENDEWMVTAEGTLICHRHMTIEPGKPEKFAPAGTVVKWGGEPFEDKPIEVWVSVFDPKKNTYELISARSRSGPSFWEKRRRSRMPKYTSWSSPPCRRSLAPKE